MNEDQKDLNEKGDYCFSIGTEFPEISSDDHNIHFHIMDYTLYIYRDGEWKILTYV